MTLANKLKTLREQKGLSQTALCKEIGISLSAYNKYETKYVRPSYDVLGKLADFYGLPIEALSKDDLSIEDIISKYRNTYEMEPYTVLPLVGIIRGGEPIYINQEQGEQEFADAKFGDGNHFMLKVQGDSMSPTIPDGAIAIIRKQDTAEEGQIVAFAVEGEYATLKRYYPQPDGSIILKGDNPKSFVYHISPEEIENGEAYIIGVCRTYKVNLY